MGSSILLVILAFFLVILNGFFVAAEFSLVKLRPTRVKALAKKYGWRGQILARVHKNLDAYLSACQLGITLASLGLGWVGEPAFAKLLTPLLEALQLGNAAIVHGISFFSAFFTISFLHIVVGELAPKSLALRRAEKVGLWAAAPLYAFYWMAYPAIWLLNSSANRVLRCVGLDGAHGHDPQYSAEELKLILRTSRTDDQFSTEDWRLLAQALDFRNLDVSDLMRPFNEAVYLSATQSTEENLRRIVEQRYSRYPYLDEEGRAKGMLHLKDIFFALQKSSGKVQLDSLLRPIVTISPSLSAAELFNRFRQGAPHFALVAHPDGRPVGYVTLDNLLGALVGEIRDEFRQVQTEWSKLDDGSLLGKGSLPLFTLERALGIDIAHGDAGSIGGLILQHLGDIPTEGQRVDFKRFEVVVKKMNGPRIVLVRVFSKDSP